MELCIQSSLQCQKHHKASGETKRFRKREELTKWPGAGNALPDNFEMQRHGSATFINILSNVDVNQSKFRKTGTFRSQGCLNYRANPGLA